MTNRLFLAAVYLVSLVYGIMTLLDPSPYVDGNLGASATALYGILLTLGGFGALIGAIMPSFKAELISLWLVMTGFAIYDIALWSILVDRIANQGTAFFDAPYGEPMSIAVLTLLLLAKIANLNHATRRLVRNKRRGLV